MQQFILIPSVFPLRLMRLAWMPQRHVPFLTLMLVVSLVQVARAA